MSRRPCIHWRNPCPGVHSDLSSAAALASADEDAAALGIDVALGEGERLADPQPGAPEEDDQRLRA
jgi:hypothetical protein